MNYGDTPLGELLKQGIDEERVFHYHHRCSESGTKMEPAADVLEAHFEDAAERLERTTGAVMIVRKQRSDRLGPSDYCLIEIVSILPRHVDADLFQSAFAEALQQAILNAQEESNR